MNGYNATNYKRQCFKCNNTVFLNPVVRKQDNPNAFDPLDEPFDETRAGPEEKQKFHRQTCTVMNQRQPTNNYQGERARFPDEMFKQKVKPDFEEEKKPASQTVTVNKGDFNQLVSDVAYIKGLLEAVIKSFDSAQKTNSTNRSLLFTTASNMATEDKEDTKTLEEDTDKIQKEQLEDEEEEEEEEEDIEDESESTN